ncbi:MAG TPA: glycoside hydrolase family 3 N-terminal domain-containing protein, partial [Variovorax sp.]|nr:glycoside hydrolase family 3 N-terminal domain-containing protein [Variovorax sp.]
MHVRIPAMAAALLGLASALFSPASLSAPATAEGADARIESLIARMTVEEKIGQLSLYGPANTNIPGNPQAGQRNAQQEIDDVRAGRVTGLFNNEGLERKRVLQEVAVRESRLGIPLLYGADVIHGFRTIFPMPLAEAASWEPELAER